MKKLITFLAIAFFAQLGFAQEYYLTIEGSENQSFVLYETATDLEIERLPARSLQIVPTNINESVKIEIWETGEELLNRPFVFSELGDGLNGKSPFTSVQDVLDWSNEHLAKSKGSGATGTAATVNITSPNNTIDVSDDGAGNFSLSVNDDVESIQLQAGGLDLTTVDANVNTLFIHNSTGASQFLTPNFISVPDDEMIVLRRRANGNFEETLQPNLDYDHISVNGNFDLTNYNGDAQLITTSSSIGTVQITYGTGLAPQTLTLLDGEARTFYFNGVTGWNCLDCIESVIYNGATIISSTNTIAGMATITTRDGGSLLDHINSHATNNVSFNTDGTETWQELADIFGLNSVNLIKLGGNTTEPQVLTSLIQKGFYSVRRVGPNLEVKEISKPQVVGRLDEVTAKIHSVVIPSKGGLNDLTNQGHGLNPVLGEVAFDTDGNAIYSAGIRSSVNTDFENSTGVIYALVDPDAVNSFSVFTAPSTFVPLAQNSTNTETIRLTNVSDANPFSIDGVSGFATRQDVLDAIATGNFVVLKIEGIPSGTPFNIGDHQNNPNFDFQGALKALIIVDGEVDDNDDTIINHAIQNDIDPLRLSRVSGITKEIANFEIENTNNGGGGTGQLFIDLDPIVITEPTILRFEHTSTVTNGSNYFTFGTTAGQETDGIGSLNNANIRLTPTKSSETFDIRVQPGTYHTRIGSGGGSASTSSSLKITEIKTGLIDVSELSNISADAGNSLTLGSD